MSEVPLPAWLEKQVRKLITMTLPAGFLAASEPGNLD